MADASRAVTLASPPPPPPPPQGSERLWHDAQEDECCRTPPAVADASHPLQCSKRFRHDAQDVDCLPLRKRGSVPLSPAISSHLYFLESLCEFESTPQDDAASLPLSSESTCSQELLLAEMMLSLEKVIGDGGADAKGFANEPLQRPTDCSPSPPPSSGKESEVQARIRHLLEVSDDELGLLDSSASGDVARQLCSGEPAAVPSSSPQTSGEDKDWSALDDDEVQQVYSVGAWWLHEAFEHCENSGTPASSCLIMVDL